MTKKKERITGWGDLNTAIDIEKIGRTKKKFKGFNYWIEGKGKLFAVYKAKK